MKRSDIHRLDSRKRAALAFLALALLAGCAALPGALKLPKTHPESTGPGAPVCSRCHEDADPIDFAAYDHRGDWLASHRYPAFGGEQVCAMCHRPASCTDCHAASSELPPAVKRPGEVGRELIHRGDYLTRHRIDGRVDPFSCARCHGNPKTSRTCAPCHG